MEKVDEGEFLTLEERISGANGVCLGRILVGFRMMRELSHAREWHDTVLLLPSDLN